MKSEPWYAEKRKSVLKRDGVSSQMKRFKMRSHGRAAK